MLQFPVILFLLSLLPSICLPAKGSVKIRTEDLARRLPKHIEHIYRSHVDGNPTLQNALSSLLEQYPTAISSLLEVVTLKRDPKQIIGRIDDVVSLVSQFEHKVAHPVSLSNLIFSRLFILSTALRHQVKSSWIVMHHASDASCETGMELEEEIDTILGLCRLGYRRFGGLEPLIFNQFVFTQVRYVLQTILVSAMAQADARDALYRLYHETRSRALSTVKTVLSEVDELERGSLPVQWRNTVPVDVSVNNPSLYWDPIEFLLIVQHNANRPQILDNWPLEMLIFISKMERPQETILAMMQVVNELRANILACRSVQCLFALADQFVYEVTDSAVPWLSFYGLQQTLGVSGVAELIVYDHRLSILLHELGHQDITLQYRLLLDIQDIPCLPIIITSTSTSPWDSRLPEKRFAELTVYQQLPSNARHLFMGLHDSGLSFIYFYLLEHSIHLPSMEKITFLHHLTIVDMAMMLHHGEAYIQADLGSPCYAHHRNMDLARAIRDLQKTVNEFGFMSRLFCSLIVSGVAKVCKLQHNMAIGKCLVFLPGHDNRPNSSCMLCGMISLSHLVFLVLEYFEGMVLRILAIEDIISRLEVYGPTKVDPRTILACLELTSQFNDELNLIMEVDNGLYTADLYACTM